MKKSAIKNGEFVLNRWKYRMCVICFESPPYNGLTLMLIILCLSCSSFNLQVPRTTPVGKTSIGVSFTKVGFEELFPLPSTWLRYGATPHLDYGLSLFGIGGKADIKYSFNDYIAIGGGTGVFWIPPFPFVSDRWTPAYELEGSLYLGAPIRALYPYSVTRVQNFFIDIINTRLRLLRSTIGMRAPFSEKLYFYVEAGTYFELSATEELGHPFVFSFGFSNRLGD